MDVSVVVPAYRADRTLGACLDALLAQDFPGAYEVVLVVSADREAELPDPAGLPAAANLKVVRQVPRLGAREARHRGVAEATGAALAFTDADAVADPGWLAALVAASEGGSQVVAGAVVNGTPRSLAGTAEYVFEFSDLCPQRPPATVRHGALCNLLVPRARWEALGPFPELGGGDEDVVFTARARAAGCLVFAPAARVAHRNRTSARAVVRHQHDLGRWAAHAVRAVPRGGYRGAFFVRRPVLAPVAAAGRFAAACLRVVRWLRGQRAMAAAASPIVLAAAAAWGVGLAREGLALGPPRSPD